MAAIDGVYLLIMLVVLLPTACCHTCKYESIYEWEIIIPNYCTKVVISNLRMSNYFAGSLAQAISADTAVNTLELRDIEMADDGVAFFANALKTNTAITNFSLGLERYNEGIGDAAVASFAEAIKLNTAITSFVLIGSGGISDNGMVLLSQALISNAAITELNLESNGISDAGAASLRMHEPRAHRM